MAASEGVVIEKIQILLAVVTVAALIAAAMGIASLMSTIIIERSKEIGLMKVIGAHQWQITLLFYCEAMVSSLIDGLFGCIAGCGLVRVIGMALFNASLSFSWIVVPCVLVLSLSLLIVLIGTWFPAHRIARLYPVEVYMGAKQTMFWRLVFRALRLRLQRVLIIFITLMVGASIVTAIATVYFDINTKMSQELRTFGANFYIGKSDGSLLAQSQVEEIIDQAPAG